MATNAAVVLDKFKKETQVIYGVTFKVEGLDVIIMKLSEDVYQEGGPSGVSCSIDCESDAEDGVRRLNSSYEVVKIIACGNALSRMDSQDAASLK